MSSLSFLEERDPSHPVFGDAENVDCFTGRSIMGMASATTFWKSDEPNPLMNQHLKKEDQYYPEYSFGSAIESYEYVEEDYTY